MLTSFVTSALTPSLLPSIRDPALLIKECAQLVASNPLGGIKSNKWPPSVSALHPVYVMSDGYDINITTFEDVGRGSRGYRIVPGKGPIIVDPKYLTEICPGIYSWSEPF
jgi:hypothetical protein